MKALAVQQPFAWLIVQGLKDIKNRTWLTHHRGPCIVHANKAIDEAVVGQERTRLARENIVIPEDLPRGGIVGVVTLVDCVERIDRSWWRRILCQLFRNRPTYCVDQTDSVWFTGSYGFILRDPRPLPYMPYRG